MSTVKKPRAKTSKKKKEIEEDLHSSSDENDITMEMTDSSSDNKIMINNDLVHKKSKAFNSELFKLLDMLNRNKQDFTEAFKKVEDYNYDKFSDLTHDYEKKELDHAEKSDNLRKSFEELHNKLTKEYTEKKYKTDKEFSEKKYDLDKLYEEKKYNFGHEFQKSVDEMERKKENDAYNFCLQVLKQKGETTIKASDLNEKNDKLENMIEKHEEELENLEEKLTDQHEKEMKYELEKIELTNRAESANLTAKNEQNVKQIEVLQDTIKSLKVEINEQRNLTKHVAEAGKQGQIVQNMGGK